MASFASRKNAACGKTMQANSYWNVPLLDAPHQSGTDRKEHRKYLTRVFQMRDPDITSIDQMNNLNVSLNTSRKDDWQEANEAQSCKLGDVSGRYSEKNDYNTKMVCKLLQQQAASHSLSCRHWHLCCCLMMLLLLVMLLLLLALLLALNPTWVPE